MTTASAILVAAAMTSAIAASTSTTASLAKQQPQQRDARVAPPPAPTGTGTLGGTVVADADGHALRLASVVLIGASTGTLRVTSTDNDGRFAFTALPADRYLVGASKTPYLGAVAGARRAARPGAPIAVADGQKIADVSIRLPMGAVIAGALMDDRGQPAAGGVVVVQKWKVQNGDRTLVNAAQSATADGHGRYRVFGLPPGEYIVSAIRGGGPAGTAGTSYALADGEVDRLIRGQATIATPATADAPKSYSAVFFPGTPRQADAVPIALNAGEERTGIDFVLNPIPVGSVQGAVVTADGQAAGPLAIFLTTSGGGPIQNTMQIRPTPDGRFTASNVTPGSYVLIARTSQLQGGPGSPPPPTSQPLAGIATVEVAGDVTGVQILLRSPMTITGRVAFHGTTQTPSLAGQRVPFRSSLAGFAAATVSPTDAAGGFKITGVIPGRYSIGGAPFFGANTDSVTWSLESVTVDGKDMTDLPIDIGDQPPKDIVITYGDRWQQIAGRLTKAGAPATDYVIVVFPKDRAYWTPGSRRILTTRPGTDGRFTISGPGPSTLPPGDYLLAAVTDLDRDEQYDPALLSTLVAGAVPVTLAPGDRKTQDLVVR